jgi:hypothetical protein
MNVSIILSREDYSKSKLEQVFNFYSSYHQNFEDHLLVAVYTDMKRDDGDTSLQDRTGVVADWDALFQREKDPLFTTPYNAWYGYAVDLDHPAHQETVVITGVNPFDPDVNLAYVRQPEGVNNFV